MPHLAPQWTRWLRLWWLDGWWWMLVVLIIIIPVMAIMKAEGNFCVDNSFQQASKPTCVRYAFQKNTKKKKKYKEKKTFCCLPPRPTTSIRSLYSSISWWLMSRPLSLMWLKGFGIGCVGQIGNFWPAFPAIALKRGGTGYINRPLGVFALRPIRSQAIEVIILLKETAELNWINKHLDEKRKVKWSGDGIGIGIYFLIILRLPMSERHSISKGGNAWGGAGWSIKRPPTRIYWLRNHPTTPPPHHHTTAPPFKGKLNPFVKRSRLWDIVYH